MRRPVKEQSAAQEKTQGRLPLRQSCSTSTNFAMSTPNAFAIL